jgi:hypothetical protein
VAPRLARLDLTVDDLLAPIRAGFAARRTSTRHHPRSYGGWRDYAERTAALRDGLVPRGWAVTEDEGVCLTVHPNGRLAVMTALGDSGTGTRGEVTTMRRRGKITEKIVAVNAQLALDFPIPDGPPSSVSRWSTWVLLVHHDGDEVRSELSLAAHIGEDGYIDRWNDRIPLPVIRFNEMPDLGDDDLPPDPDFDVPEL